MRIISLIAAGTLAAATFASPALAQHRSDGRHHGGGGYSQREWHGGHGYGDRGGYRYGHRYGSYGGWNHDRDRRYGYGYGQHYGYGHHYGYGWRGGFGRRHLVCRTRWWHHRPIRRCWRGWY